MLTNRLNIVKMPMFPKLVHTFYTVKIKVLFFKKLDKWILKYVWKSNGHNIAKRLLTKLCKVGELACLSVKRFKTYWINIMWYLWRNRQINETGEKAKNNPCRQKFSSIGECPEGKGADTWKLEYVEKNKIKSISSLLLSSPPLFSSVLYISRWKINDLNMKRELEIF